MKNILKFSLFAILAVGLSSCIEITEKAKFNSDNSGTFSMTIDMSQMKDMMLAMGMHPDSLKGSDNPMEGLEEDFQEQKEKLEAIRGVSNARVEMDEENFVISALFDFEDIDALNAGIGHLLAEGEIVENPVFYRQRGRTIERTSENTHVAKMKAEMTDNQEMQGMDPAMVFGDMSYNVVMEFSKPIDNVSNANYTLSADGKSTQLRYFMFRPESEKLSFENSVSF
ncbi:MAG: hypothetical protein HWE14_09780 [Flavobacteriia bacterium]|nr:hypothetical protein [Flavobacteriia bacterium]